MHTDTRMALLLGMVVVCSLSSASANGQSEAKSGITMSLEPRIVGKPGRLLIDLLLRNEGKDEVSIGSWLVFSKCQIRDRSLHIRDAHGKELVLRGRDIGYGADEPEEILRPGESLRITGLDVTEFYEFPRSPERLWMWFDSIAFRAGGGVAKVRSKEVAIVFPPTPIPRVRRPVEGRVGERSKRGTETVVTCASSQ